MLPIVPFDVLLPVAVGAAVLALSLVSLILLRRALVRWWTLGGRRARRRAEALILADMAEGTRNRTARWVSRGPASRVRAFLQAMERVRREHPEARDWVRASDLPRALADQAGRSRWSGLPGRRWRRIEALLAVGALDLPVRSILMETLDDPDPEVAYAAAEAIAGVDFPEGARALFRRIGESSTLQDSRLATMVESMPGDVTAVLADGLVSDEPAHVYWALNLIGRKKVYELLEQVRPHLESEDPDVRVAACKCLGELRVRLTDRWLAPLLRDDSWFVQAQAAKALGRMGADWVAEDMAPLLTSPHWWVRQNAAEALMELGAAAEQPVEEVLFADDPYARNAAVEVLARVGWIRSRVIRAATGDEDARQMLEWYGACGGLGHLENALAGVPETTVPTLLGIVEPLGDGATYGRIRAARHGMSPELQELCIQTADRVKSR